MQSCPCHFFVQAKQQLTCESFSLLMLICHGLVDRLGERMNTEFGRIATLKRKEGVEGSDGSLGDVRVGGG